MRILLALLFLEFATSQSRSEFGLQVHTEPHHLINCYMCLYHNYFWYNGLCHDKDIQDHTPRAEQIMRYAGNFSLCFQAGTLTLQEYIYIYPDPTTQHLMENAKKKSFTCLYQEEISSEYLLTVRYFDYLIQGKNNHTSLSLTFTYNPLSDYRYLVYLGSNNTSVYQYNRTRGNLSVSIPPGQTLYLYQLCPPSNETYSFKESSFEFILPTQPLQNDDPFADDLIDDGRLGYTSYSLGQTLSS